MKQKTLDEWFILGTQRGREVFLVLMCCLLIFVLRLPMFPWLHTYVRDEQIYWTVGQNIAQGGVPYVSMWEHKGPVLFYLLAIPSYFFPESVIAQRVFLSLVILLTVVFLYLTLIAYVQRLWAAIAAASYGLIISSWKVGFAGFAETYCLLFVAISWYLLILWQECAKKKMYLWGIGICISAILLCKMNVVLCLLAGPLFLWRGNFHDFLKDSSHVVLGISLPLVVCIFYFYRLGNLDDFIRGYILFDIAYVSEFTWEYFFISLYDVSIKMIYPAAGVGFCLFTILLMWFRYRTLSIKEKKLFSIAVVTLLGVGLSIVIPRHHYMQYLLPLFLAMTLFVALFLQTILRLKNEVYKTLEVLILGLALFLIVIQLPASWNKYLIAQDKLRKTPEYRAAEYIKSYTTPDQSIFVISHDQSIYFLSSRVAPSRIFVWLHYSKFREENIRNMKIADPFKEVITRPPAMVVLSNPKNPPLPPSGSFFRTFLDNNYTAIATFGWLQILQYKNASNRIYEHPEP